MNKIPSLKSISPAYRQHRISEAELTKFNKYLTHFIASVEQIEQTKESEEHLKKNIIDFLENTFFSKHYINTKDRIDLAIYLGTNIQSGIGVLIETKKPANASEFPTSDDLNRKAIHELLLYYLRERIDYKNNNIKHVIATNGYEWFLFKGEDFYDYFYQNKALVKEYTQFRDGKKDTTKNELFYNEIAYKYLKKVQNELPFVHVDLRDKKTSLETGYKLFSNAHLLGERLGNDANQLNKEFYNELLHIIGLEEVEKGGKKLIIRKKENLRDNFSLLENTIYTIEKDNSFEKALELSIIWINRILFLKLLEAQLIRYNEDKKVAFLHSDFITGFDGLKILFFNVLAKQVNERAGRDAEKYKHIPYLNSSLFEPIELEKECSISSLQDGTIPIYKSTVLTDNKGKKREGELDTLKYLFQFLDAYDFSTSSRNEYRGKTIVNASVLGLIFEKINGYKDGSFFTPSFITMYMCRETIRKAAVQKFNELKNSSPFEEGGRGGLNKYFENLDDIADEIGKGKMFTKQEANRIINSLRICDPAVGSGHFLVSALNEIIQIKHDLNIVIDENGTTISKSDYTIKIENDELIITNENGKEFTYKPQNEESQRLQKTLFHEKQTVIENCLFGADINANSVKICQLRLWIELLKNTYYKEDNQLETLPNIDINIKTGNSLISRFELGNKKTQPHGIQQKIERATQKYKDQVALYKMTDDKKTKEKAKIEIEQLKEKFAQIGDSNDNDYNLLQKKEGELSQKTLGFSFSDKEDFNKKTEKLVLEITVLKEKLKQKYHNAIEWRFEFPEVLDDNGNFIGFDAVLGNPPYISNKEIQLKQKIMLKERFVSAISQYDLYSLFIEQALNISKKFGYNSLIVPDSFLSRSSFMRIRKLLMESCNIMKIVHLDRVFSEASVSSCVYLLQNAKTSGRKP